MKLAIMQPYIFPYIGYFQLINAVDTFVCLEDVNFIKKGWIHRNKISTKNGDLMFTVPLNKPSQNKKIIETTLHATYEVWKEKFKQTLQHTYRNHPYFKETYGSIKWVLDLTFPGDSISDLSGRSIASICDILDINTKITASSLTTTGDLKGEDRIIRICLAHKADSYINAIGGKDLYSKDSFDRYGINLSFIGCQLKQTDSFNPYLSILDLLFKYPTCQIKDMLYNYSLVQNG